MLENYCSQYVTLMLQKLDTRDCEDFDKGESNNIKIVEKLVEIIVNSTPKSVHVRHYAGFRQGKQTDFHEQFIRRYDSAKIKDCNEDQRKTLDLMKKISNRKLLKELLKIDFNEDFTYSRIEKIIHQFVSLNLATEKYNN